MAFIEKVGARLFSSVYNVVPTTVKNIFPRDLRTKVKLLVNFEEYQSDELRKMQLKMEAAKYFQNRDELNKSLELWNELTQQSKNIHAYDSEVRYNKKLVQTLLNFDSYKDKVRDYQAGKDLRAHSDTKIVVYTAVTGGYESIKMPLEIDNRFDYVVFSDAPVKVAGVWQVKPIDYFFSDPTRTARYIKTHPHILLKDYDLAIWVDGNLVTTGDLSEFIDGFIASKKAVAAIPHPYRENLYQEFEACKNQSKDESKVMSEQITRYKSEGFRNTELAETGFMMFDLKRQELSSILTQWWKEIDSGSKRDQLSFNYSLGDHGYFALMDKPNTVRSHPSLALLPHGANDIDLVTEKMGGQFFDPYKDKNYAEVKSSRIKAQRTRAIDIIVCVHNALEEVKNCLGSIEKHRNSDSHRLIVIDDGSGPETSEFLREFAQEKPYCILERSEVGRGYTRAANHGLSLSQAEMVILLNSDTVVTSHWCEKLADALFSDENLGVVGPLSNAASHQSIPEHKSKNKQTAINTLPKGLTPEDMNDFCEKNSLANHLPRVPLVHGFCFAIKKEVIERLGLFDVESFPRGYGEENDYCFRATDAGYSHAIATHTYVFHVKSKSYDSKKRIQLMKDGSKNLLKKHGKDRVIHSVITMQENPTLIYLRERARNLY